MFKTKNSNGTQTLDGMFVRKDAFGLGTGGLWGFGEDLYGQLGDGSVVNKSSPVQVITGGANWAQVAGGYRHTAAIKSDGTLWAWGQNANGCLGDNTGVNKSSPVQTVSAGSNWKQVAAGYQRSVAIKTNGSLWSWGQNNYGQLGDNTVAAKSSPVQTITAGTNWAQVAAGDFHTAAIKTDGTLWLWGDNSWGKLGDNTNTAKSSPVQTVAGGNNWKQVVCGWYNTAAIKTDGTLWMWGINLYGTLGDNTVTPRSSPVQTVAGGTNWKQVACSQQGYHTAAIKTDGSLWTWGYDNYGQLGDNTVVNKSSPVQTVAGGNNWKNVTAGASHCAAVKTDGTLWAWGYNSTGQLGNTNTSTRRSSPVQTVAAGTNWKAVSAGANFTEALTV